MNRQFTDQRWPLVVAVTLCAAALALGAGLVLRGSRNAFPSLPSPPHARRDLSVARHIGPLLRELKANFAVLRRPATASEHALLPTFTARTNNQPEVPEYVRRAGVVEGIPVYFVVYPIFRHGASGPVVAYQMNVIANAGFAWGPGDYLIFPTVIGTSAQGGLWQPRAYLSVVPDGVRRVRWHFTCKQAPSGTGCEVSSATASAPVHGNLAVLPITTYGTAAITTYGTAVPTVSEVTWYHSDGSRTVFRNQNSAVPFAGAPARRVG